MFGFGKIFQKFNKKCCFRKNICENCQVYPFRESISILTKMKSHTHIFKNIFAKICLTFYVLQVPFVLHLADSFGIFLKPLMKSPCVLIFTNYFLKIQKWEKLEHINFLFNPSVNFDSK
jgi:hypothetical protein